MHNTDKKLLESISKKIMESFSPILENENINKVQQLGGSEPFEKELTKRANEIGTFSKELNSLLTNHHESPYSTDDKFNQKVHAIYEKTIDLHADIVKLLNDYKNISSTPAVPNKTPGQ